LLELGLREKIGDAEPHHGQVGLLTAARDELVINGEDTPRLTEHFVAANRQFHA